MRIVIDSNILFSALIRDSKTRELILNYDNSFLFPSFIFVEMKKYKNELLQKSGLNEKEFNKLLEIILKKVIIVPSEVLNLHKKEALKIIKDIDPDDALFIACSLAYQDSIIWSDDKELKKQDKIKVFNTAEIMNLMN